LKNWVTFFEEQGEVFTERDDLVLNRSLSRAQEVGG